MEYFMKKDFEEIKKELEDRIKTKQRILIEKTAKESERKSKIEEITKLREQEKLLDNNLNSSKKSKKILNGLGKYAMTHPVETVFHFGALLMLIQQEWLLFLFCLVFPLFVPMLMQKKEINKEKKNDK